MDPRVSVTCAHENKEQAQCAINVCKKFYPDLEYKIVEGRCPSPDSRDEYTEGYDMGYVNGAKAALAAISDAPTPREVSLRQILEDAGILPTVEAVKAKEADRERRDVETVMQRKLMEECVAGWDPRDRQLYCEDRHAWKQKHGI